MRVARSARDGVHAIDELPALLPDADVVVLVRPAHRRRPAAWSTPAFLARMKDGALLVNVARGAGRRHRRPGRRAARRAGSRAAVDVVDPEPLPADQPALGRPGPADLAARRRREQRDVAAGAPAGPRPAAPVRRRRAACERHDRRLLTRAVDSATWQAGSARTTSPRCARRPASTRSSRQYVTLRNAGGGSLKGLCPFHDEKSPSFHVTPGPRVLPLLRLRRGRRRHHLPDEDRRARPSPRRSSGSPTSTASQLRREEGDVRDDRPKGPAAAAG